MLGAFWGRLKRQNYIDDTNVAKGKANDRIKNKILVPVPKGMTQDEFDETVIQVAESFGNDDNITYNLCADKETTGNCNSSTSTILLKSGVPKNILKRIWQLIEGIKWGFSIYTKPWSKEEQKNAVDEELKEVTNPFNNFH